MEKDILTYVFYGLFILLFSSCGNKIERETDNGIINQTELKTQIPKEVHSDFIYTKAGKKVKMVFENGTKSLVIGVPTRAKFETENINNQRLMVIGAGIRVNGADKDGFRFTITPNERTLVDGNLEIQVVENVENGENFTHKFFVPVMNTADKN